MEYTINYNKIKGLLAENDITRKQASEQLNLTEKSFRFKMNGTWDFKVLEFLKLAELLNIDIEDLYIFFTNQVS